MAQVTKKDLVAAINEERQASGKITRKSSTRKNENGKEEATNLYYVCDRERKLAFKRFIGSISDTIGTLEREQPEFSKLVAQFTNELTQLLVSENENGNKCKNHVTIGRKQFGVLDYYPTNMEQLLVVLEGARLAIKENRVAQQEQQREQERERKQQQAVQQMSMEQLLAALTPEQLAMLQAAASSK